MCLFSHNSIWSNPLSNNSSNLSLQKKIHPNETSTQNFVDRPADAHKVYYCMIRNTKFDGFCLLSIRPYKIFDNWLLVGLLALVPPTFMD
jgi:hypothetical protein